MTITVFVSVFSNINLLVQSIFDTVIFSLIVTVELEV